MRRLLIAKEQLYLCQSGPHDSCGIAAKRGIRADVRGKIIAEGKWPEYNLPPGKKKEKRKNAHKRGGTKIKGKEELFASQHLDREHLLSLRKTVHSGETELFLLEHEMER
jgi:hypothetical protein